MRVVVGLAAVVVDVVGRIVVVKTVASYYFVAVAASCRMIFL